MIDRGRKLLVAVIALGLFAGLAAAPSSANSTRVSVSNYEWSNQAPSIDKGESVTFDWPGPDTIHSVTGQAPNATQWDSNPGESVPKNVPGREFKITFDQPGTYNFVCRLHASVRGTVTVSNTPGDPNSDPGPAPPIDFDTTPPTIEDARLTTPFIGPRGKGTGLSAQIDEAGSLSADYYRQVKRGNRTVSRYAGYSDWPTFIGINSFTFGKRSRTFRADPGRYTARLRATDAKANQGPAITVGFEISKKTKRK